MRVEALSFATILDLKNERKRGVKENFKAKLDQFLRRNFYLFKFPRALEKVGQPGRHFTRKEAIRTNLEPMAWEQHTIRRVYGRKWRSRRGGFSNMGDSCEVSDVNTSIVFQTFPKTAKFSKCSV